MENHHAPEGRPDTPSCQLPTRSLSAVPNLHDLELMHQWCVSTSTISQKPPLQKIWQTEIPKVALIHPFLMHGILAMSALHLHRMSPSPKSHRYSELALTHQQLALADFNPALETITEENATALFAFSCLFAALSFADVQARSVGHDASEHIANVVGVFELLLGCTVIAHKARRSLEKGPLSPLLRREHFVVGVEGIKDNVLDPDVLAALRDLDTLSKTVPVVEGELNLDVMRKPADYPETNNIYEKAIFELKNTFKRVEMFGKIPGLILAWAIHVGPSFIALLKAEDPLALVIFAHYSVAMRTLDDFWWYAGLAGKVFHSIDQMIDPTWKHSLNWPRSKFCAV